MSDFRFDLFARNIGREADRLYGAPQLSEDERLTYGGTVSIVKWLVHDQHFESDFRLSDDSFRALQNALKAIDMERYDYAVKARRIVIRHDLSHDQSAEVIPFGGRPK